MDTPVSRSVRHVRGHLHQNDGAARPESPPPSARATRRSCAARPRSRQVRMRRADARRGGSRRRSRGTCSAPPSCSRPRVTPPRRPRGCGSSRCSAPRPAPRAASAPARARRAPSCRCSSKSRPEPAAQLLRPKLIIHAPLALSRWLGSSASPPGVDFPLPRTKPTFACAELPTDLSDRSPLQATRRSREARRSKWPCHRSSGGCGGGGRHR